MCVCVCVCVCLYALMCVIVYMCERVCEWNSEGDKEKGQRVKKVWEGQQQINK